ncbi:MAG: hypothetical protein ACRDI1_08405 [Actinomycetota bacterium]
MRSPRAVVAGLLLAVLMLAPQAVGSEATDEREIQSLLDRRAGGLLSGDRAGFLGTVDPSRENFLRAQEAHFDRLRPLRLAAYTLEIDLEESPDLARPRDRRRYGAPVRVGIVEENIQIDGYDEGPVLGFQLLTFVKRDREWLVASDTDTADLGLNTARHPWDFGPLALVGGDHFLVVAHPPDEEFARQLLPLAEEALSQLNQFWGEEWSRRVVVYLPASRLELEKLLDATVDVTNFVAFATASVDRADGWEPRGSRVILNPDNFARHSAEGQRAILTHELLHVATRGAGGPFVNLLVEEGFAQLAEPPGFTGDSELIRQARSGTFSGKLPEDLEFVGGGPSEIGLAYQKAFSSMSFLRDRFGPERLIAFYQSYGKARVEPGTSRYHLDRALRAATGLSLDEFERQWADSVSSRAG